MSKSSVFCKADDKLSMFSVIKIDKMKCPMVIAFLIVEGSLTSKHLAIIPDESVSWYLLTRRVGGGQWIQAQMSCVATTLAIYSSRYC